MINRPIVRIDEEKCNGCGKCIAPCSEGAIAMINGKAKVISEELCDGMGHCIGICPHGAITIEQRQTLEFKPKVHVVGKKDNSMQCFMCGRLETNAYLMPVRNNMESKWVCTQCLPRLIHG